MIHGPCHAIKDYPCIDDNKKCSKSFLKKFNEITQDSNDGYPVYRTGNDGKTVIVKGIECDNRSVVPYNSFLCTKYNINAHINVEICTSITAVKYLYKYVYKEHDRVMAEIRGETELLQQSTDEINQFLDARYVSASEGLWRILSYPLHEEYPAIQRLAAYLPNQQAVLFNDSDQIEQVLNKNCNTTLTRWFLMNQTDILARKILYQEVPKHYVWSKDKKKWKPREKRNAIIGRMYFVHPGEGERFYLRLLLNHVPGAQNFDDIKSCNSIIHNTFKNAAQKRGLLESDSEWDSCLNEASSNVFGKK
jgi:hypothetical protein